MDDLRDGVACSECWKSTHFFTQSDLLCDKCGAFLGDHKAPFPLYCRQCDDHHYNKAFALGKYQNALSAVIVDLKKVPRLPDRVLDRIKIIATSPAMHEVDLIVPVPLSVGRHKDRGFNQAEIIANALAAFSGVPVDAASLARTTDTPMHRGGMDQKAREMTVRKAFEVVRPKLVAGKSVILVDDVFTSGSTASFCSKALRKHGANGIKVFTLARAVKLSW